MAGSCGYPHEHCVGDLKCFDCRRDEGCGVEVHEASADLSQEKKSAEREAFLIVRGGYGSASVLAREVVFAESKDVAERFAAEKYKDSERVWHRVEPIPFTLIGGKCPFCSPAGFPFDLSDPIGL